MRIAAIITLLCAAAAAQAGAIPGFQPGPHFDEQVRKLAPDEGVCVVINAPPSGRFDDTKQTSLILYALPNGNTIEQTIGCARAPGLDWHFDTQHIGAQTRLLRKVMPDINIVVAYLEADGRSWPAWRASRPDNFRIIRRIVDAIAQQIPGQPLSITLATPAEGRWGTFGGPRAFEKWIQPAPATTQATTLATGIPDRPADAPGGREFMRSIADLPPQQREQRIAQEIGRGNLPMFLSQFKPIRVEAVGIEGVKHRAQYWVMPDYLSVGSDDDWVRVPMTPMTAQKIADAFGCSLPTRKMADDIYGQADVKLRPQPLMQDREAVATFVQHHQIIETQRGDRPPGLLIAGSKKDVVITNRLRDKPNRVAIYGWHRPDGSPIQPLTIAHKDTYVDYSHGIRLVKRMMLVDDRPMPIEDVLNDPHLCNLLSDEGRIAPARYP